ncbi:glycine receptor ora transientless isoform X2 [Rhodnius prolixus]|uniref:glycine receptor ora transientless isoform X2 n=2 Tax=Rhodnius prolixus TaxID=13249 RepID=UPI003D18A5C7
MIVGSTTWQSMAPQMSYPKKCSTVGDIMTIARVLLKERYWLQIMPDLCQTALVYSLLLHTQLFLTISGLSFNEILPEDQSLYDKMRPPKKNGNPTVVFFHVTVMGLDSIDENSMTYVADIFFAQTWKDYRLRLPENMTSEYRLLEVDWLKNMWRPDSFFKNAKSVTFQTMTIPNHYIWLYKDKTILYMVKLTLRLSCVMNFMIYPHDTQECKLQMESLSHTTDDLVFQWEPNVPLVVDENIELPQLQLVQNKTADCTQVYSTGNFTCLEVIFVLKRRLGYYLFHTYFPTCLIVIMSWVSFWIKPEAAPARVTLGVTSLLTLSTQHAKSQASLPPVSYIKAVDAFMSVCTVFVFLALMEYCLVNIVLGDNDGPKMPEIPNQAANIRNMSVKESKELRNLGVPPPPPRPSINLANRNRMRAIRIDKFSRIFFPVLFTALNLSYWYLFAEHL